MTLLFDQNLSFKLLRLLEDEFERSQHVHALGLAESSDLEIWSYAAGSGLTIVSKDADFADMASVFGPPPSVIWLRCGNVSTTEIAARLSIHKDQIEEAVSAGAPYIEIY